MMHLARDGDSDLELTTRKHLTRRERRPGTVRQYTQTCLRPLVGLRAFGLADVPVKGTAAAQICLIECRVSLRGGS